MHQGKSKVVLVSPTGSGKTTMAAEVSRRARERGHGVLCISHREEIISQLRLLGSVMTIQTWLNRRDLVDLIGKIGLLILDECHHYASDEWKSIFHYAAGLRILGLTATPQRSDNKPLGNYFDDMVVAAQPSELLRLGFLCNINIIRPNRCIAPNIAMHPVKAYLENPMRGPTICYVRFQEQAEELSTQFNTAGISSRAITAKTPKDSRKSWVESYRNGETKVLVNVFTLTEGLDVPETDTIILARGCSFAGSYLQMVGRALRQSAGKASSLLIDLTGVSHVHGHPFDDRIFSLERGIELPKPVAVFQCPACGKSFPDPFMICSECGFNSPKKNKERPKILDLELNSEWCGKQTSDSLKAKELERLLSIREVKGFSLWWVVKEYKKLFTDPPIIPNDESTKIKELRGNLEFAKSRGFKPGWATWRFKETFGHWPPKVWMD